MRKVELAEIKGVVLCHNSASFDSRGSFTKYFNRDLTQGLDFNPEINSLSIATNTESGTMRGLHFQSPPFEEEKVIVCLQGRIFDVVVDLRHDSPTQGKWAAVELNGDVPTSLCLPKGLAHGYQTLTANVSVLYALGATFSEAHAHTLNYADSELGIDWPIPVSRISEKDLTGLSLSGALTLAN